ncbi:MAG: amidohydrolase family protein [Chthonomonas sp.]|nr:amidohydrolase family protein [Chthonomonas sp.]
MSQLKTSTLACLALLATCGHAQYKLPYETEADRKPKIVTRGDCFIKAGRIITVTGATIKNGQIIVRKGRIAAIGTNLKAPAGMTVIDAEDQVVMPGIIDAHVHRGIESTNEGAESISAEVRVADVLNPSSLTWWQAAASGETTALFLHGSSNAIGGQSVVAKYRFGKTTKEALFDGAPRMVKFALGENVTRMNGGGGATTQPVRFPMSRMGQEAVYRRAFSDAKQYMAEWDRWNKSDRTQPPPRKDLRLEALADILRGRIWVNCHGYRADELLMMAKLSKELGFKIATLTHALEAYKIAPELAELGVGVSMFADHWSFKLEGYEAIPSGPVICVRAGVLTSINTDGTNGTTALIFDAARSTREGLNENEALRLVTMSPAKQLGISNRVGSIEVGKDADLAFYDGHPFNVTSKNTMTLIDGEVIFERRDAFKVGKSPLRSLDLVSISGPSVIPLPKPAKVYSIQGATVYPVSGEPIANGEVVLSNGRIAYVGRRLSRPFAPNAVTVNATGLRVYPGFIDAGAAFGLSEIPTIRQMQDTSEQGEFQADLMSATAVQGSSGHFGPALCNGLLTLVTRPGGGMISGQAALLKSWAWNSVGMALDRHLAMQVNMPTTGRNFGGGHVHDDSEIQDEDMQGRQGNQPEQAPVSGRMRVLESFFDGAIAYAKNRKEKPLQTPIDLRQEAMIPVIEGKMSVFLRVRNVESIRSSIQLAKKYKLKAILVGANEAWRIADEVKKAGYPIIITPAGAVELDANRPTQAFDPYDTPYVVPTLLSRAGIKFCFMSDDNAMSMNLPSKVGMSQAYGLDNGQALRALTLSTAEILGWQKELGSIEVGKRGTLIITDGDALSATGRVKMAFIDGRPIELSSIHTMARDKYMRRLDASEAMYAK